MGVLEKVAAAEFLGMEFATWLFYNSYQNNGKLTIPGLEPFELWFESPVTMASDYGEATQVTLKGGTPLEGPEAQSAFLAGKKISRVKVRINLRNQTYSFSFNPLNFNVSGLRLPAPPGAEGPDYAFVRLEIFEEFEKFIGELFQAYMVVRADDKKWPGESEAIKAWIRDLAGT